MKRTRLITEVFLLCAVVLLINADTLLEGVVHGRWDHALVASIMSGEDELRYLGKIREAAEGHWLMGNPFLKEYRATTFSPSGFLEWIPAVLLRMFGGNWAMMLLVTDLLCSAIIVWLTWAWLKRLLAPRLLASACLFALFFTSWGGSLTGLLRDAVPKFAQPFASLYVLLLALPRRGSLHAVAIRSALIGVMFYTYPYHWTLFLGCEGLLFLYALARAWKPSVRFVVRHAAASFLPFVTLAAPLAIAKHIVLSAPELFDFYSRYHIVHTHIPAAPMLQLTVALALGILVASMAYAWKYRGKEWASLTEHALPLLLPLVAMLVLLNSNVITGKDPEWLGHGGRVILPVITVALFAAAGRFLRSRYLPALSACVLMFFAIPPVLALPGAWQSAHARQLSWEASDERKVLLWLDANLPPESVIAAPRSLSEHIPVFTTHYVFFNAGAHLSFVSADEITDRYLGWAGLYPAEREPTDTATVIVFGNHPGAQWSKERTLHSLLHPGEPFGKTMADYINRQDLRRLIDAEHAAPDPRKTRERLHRYHADVVITKAAEPVPPEILAGFTQRERIGDYAAWARDAQ